MNILDPIDVRRCQAIKPNGNSFMTIGGVVGRERCKNTATCIIIQISPAEDGLRGGMSVCNECLEVAKFQLGADTFVIQYIEDVLRDEISSFKSK